MEDIAPNVFRQRAVIEAKIGIEVTAETVNDYLQGVADHLQMRIYAGPYSYSTDGLEGSETNNGYDGFAALYESGISVSLWTNEKLVSIILHTCKKFEVEKAVEFTRDFFKATDIAYKEF